VPFAYADFHNELLKGKVLLVGCPKLDDVEYYQEKITEMLEQVHLRDSLKEIMSLSKSGNAFFQKSEPWKVIKTHDQGLWHTPELELFNIDEDPLEKRNLADDEPDLTRQLLSELEAWEEDQLEGKEDPLITAANNTLPPVKWMWELVEKKDGGNYDQWRQRMGW